MTWFEVWPQCGESLFESGLLQIKTDLLLPLNLVSRITVFRASSECTKLKGPLFSPERNEKLLAEDAGHKGKHLQRWHWRNQSSFIPPHQQQIEKLDSPDLLALCDESKDDGFAVRARRTDGCGKKLRHEYLFIINTGDKCIVSHAKFKDDTKTLTQTTAYSFGKFPLVKLIQLDKSISSTNSFEGCFIYLFLFSKSPLFGIPLLSTAAQWWAQWPHGSKVLSWNPWQDKGPDPELVFGNFKGDP